jgi:aspartokinase
LGVKGWVVVYRGERLRAELLAAVLEANGIRVEVFGDTAYSAAINFTDARVMVPDDQAQTAEELIRQADAEAPPEDV